VKGRRKRGGVSPTTQKLEGRPGTKTGGVAYSYKGSIINPREGRVLILKDKIRKTAMLLLAYG